jgi:5-hydroxyisourate hydrolase-like protein (transthyretin family)
MRKTLLTIAVLGTICSSGTAWAILQETTVTITDNGKPIPSATVTLTPVEKQDPPQPKTAKTDDNGKIVLQHEEDAKKSNAPVEISITTEDGKTTVRRMSLNDLLSDVPVDISVGNCVYLNRLSDAQLKTLLDNPETRSRVAKLIDQSVTDRPARSKVTDTKEDDGKVSRKRKQVSKRHRAPTDEDVRGQSQSGMSPEAASAISTGIGIAIGIGAGRSMGRHGDGGRMQHDDMGRMRDR